MMTPEERQRVMAFILESQENFVRMTGVEKGIIRLKKNEGQWQQEQRRQKETLSGLLKASQNLVKASRNAMKRTKRSKSQADCKELIKLFRELFEVNLRRPDQPAQENS